MSELLLPPELEREMAAVYAKLARAWTGFECEVIRKNKIY